MASKFRKLAVGGIAGAVGAGIATYALLNDGKKVSENVFRSVFSFNWFRHVIFIVERVYL